MKIYFIRVGLAAGYSVKKMNRLITRYGGFPELSSKNIVDSACIYVIKKYKGDDPVGKFTELLSRISDNDHIGSVYAKTHALDSQLEQVSSDDELIEFINEHSDTVQTGYLKFCDYALQKINEAMKSDIGHARSIDSYTITWSRSMRDFAYAIENHSVRPDYSRVRENIIALGIMLNMTTLQVDEMLEMAHMEELCPKNIPECILIYCMEHAAEYRYDNGNGYDPDYLRQYTVNTMNGFRDIKELKWYMRNLGEPDR